MLDRYNNRKPSTGTLYLTATHLIFVDPDAKKETWVISRFWKWVEWTGGRVELFRLGNRVSSHGSPQRQLDDDQPQQGLPGSLLIYLFDFFIFFISLKKDKIDSLLFIYSFVLSLYYSYVALRHLPSMPVRSYVSIHHRLSGKRQFSV